jgi:type III restriction enzyme
MFRGFATDYTERVDVIGNKAFIELVEDLEREEIAFGTFRLGKDKLTIVIVQPDPDKLDKDITIPHISPTLARKKTLAEEIARLDVMAFACPRLPRKPGDTATQSFQYDGYDLLTLEKLIERSYTLPEVQTSQEVISYYAKRIAQDVKLPAQFAALVPKVREFLEHRAFGETVDLEASEILKALNSNIAHYVTVQTFVKALRQVVVEELEPQLLHAGRKLSETPPFPYSRPTLPATKTVFNLVACGNEFELAKFLEKRPM